MRPLFDDVSATEFDPESIMLYTFPEEFYHKGRESVCYAEPNYALSETDISTLAKVYPADPVVAARERERNLAQYTEVLNAAPLSAETRLRALRAVESLSNTELPPEEKRAISEELLSVIPPR